MEEKSVEHNTQKLKKLQKLIRTHREKAEVMKLYEPTGGSRSLK